MIDNNEQLSQSNPEDGKNRLYILGDFLFKGFHSICESLFSSAKESHLQFANQSTSFEERRYHLEKAESLEIKKFLATLGGIGGGAWLLYRVIKHTQ